MKRPFFHSFIPTPIFALFEGIGLFLGIEYHGRRCVAICAEANQLIPNTFLEVLDNQDIFYVVKPLF